MARQLIITGPDITLNQIKSMVLAISDKKDCKIQAINGKNTITSASVVRGEMTAEIVDDAS